MNKRISLIVIPILMLLLNLLVWGADAPETPFYIFDNGLGRGKLPLEEQAELAHQGQYAGVLYTGTKDVPTMREALRVRGLTLLGIYTGMNVAAEPPSFDPGLPEAIHQLKGTGALIAFTVRTGEVSPLDSEDRAIRVIQEVADMAAASGLRVALYPHFGYYIARIEDALRISEKTNRPNVGVIFNLCHLLRAGDEPNINIRLKQAMPKLRMVMINGADHETDLMGPGRTKWDALIQPLDRGTFDMFGFLKTLRASGYRGPIGLQCFNVPGDIKENLTRSMTAWRTFSARLAAEKY
jgi:sugar phosphate isomerase/epimerase